MMHPFLSIIIPTYNHPEQLTLCLQALASQVYPHDRFEVIVVDDGSTTSMEHPMEVVRDSLDITLIRQANAGPASARNNGVSHARGDILLFTDDDCVPAQDWLSRIAAQAAITPDYAIGGHTVNKLTTNVYSAASQLLITYMYLNYNSDAMRARFLTSNNLAFPADRFHALGGFDTSYPLAAGEDRNLCDRWIDNGFGMIYMPDAIVYHIHDLTWHSFWYKHLNYGGAAYHFHKGRARRQKKSILSVLEPILFYVKLPLAPFIRKASASKERRKVMLGILLIITQIANTCGFLMEGLKSVGQDQ